MLDKDVSASWKTVVDTIQEGVMIVDPGGVNCGHEPGAERDDRFWSR